MLRKPPNPYKTVTCIQIDMQTVYPDDSMINPEYTYHFDKLSCSRTVWFVHITFAFLVVISGLGCLLSRLSLQYKWMHPWFGRCYIIFLLWCMGTSLIIHNSGLPIAVLVSFAWVLCGLSFGWIAMSLKSKIDMKRALKCLRIFYENRMEYFLQSFK